MGVLNISLGTWHADLARKVLKYLSNHFCVYSYWVDLSFAVAKLKVKLRTMYLGPI
jgi:hypothetical protein